MARVTWKPVAAGTLALCCLSVVNAATERSGFYTIVGPDGQMIVIDRNASNKNDKNSEVTTNAKIKKKSPLTSRWSLFSRHKPAKVTESVAPITSNPRAVVGLVPQNNALPAQPSTVQAQVQPIDTKKQTSQATPQTQVSSGLPKETNHQKVVNEPNSQTVPEVLVTKPKTTSQVSDAEPVTVIDGEQYIDSEYLEQREFNLEGKKRFYNLPDGIGGHEVLEREKGVDMTVFRKQKIEKPQVVDFSKNYQRIPQVQIVALTGATCFNEKQLKGAKLFKQDEYLDFWPRPGFEPKFDFVVAKLAQPINDIQVTSYANNMSNPKFYWPLPIFLDEKGCVMEGVNAFYQATIAPTVTTHQAIQGYLHIPQNTRYILFTPLEAAADLSETQLTNKGQVRLTPIR
ncbi:putative pilus assembly protein FilE [Alkanindiges illinoisensis]|uniref:putative pilus assembly protein FilE n=1 Tax=Alkanindiges illinoisensis TaxID=197183 RepID=UPI000AC9B9FE|nr:putative pilus assembly protein FilE [Alkanindiges illinoisensis]